MNRLIEKVKINSDQIILAEACREFVSLQVGEKYIYFLIIFEF